MADIVDIVVQKTEEVVTIDVTTNETIVNIISQNGGGGAVDSVNGQTGVVVLDADDISDSTTTNKYVTSAEKTAITHSNRTILDQITEAFTTALKTAYDSSVTWITTNGTNLINHLSNTSNPHSTTATQVDALKRDGSNANSNINIGEYDLKAGQFTLDTTPTGTASVGTTRWNDTLGSTETTLKGGSVILKNGVDLVARVVNKVTPNATLTKAAYQAVRVSGAQGQRLAVAYAQANNDNNSADTIGIVCETIATNQEGFILTVGQLEGINTTGSLQGETWADGDVIYLSPNTAGALTNVKPTGATGHIVVIGYVEYSHAVNGKLYVKIMNGWELDELHNVNISSPTNNQVLAYNSTSQLWENESVNNIVITDVEKNAIELRANGVGLTTFTRFGYSTASDVTSGVAAATASGSFFGIQNRFNYTTSTVAGSLAFFRTTFGSWGGMSSGKVCEWLFGTADAAIVSGARSFVGFTNNFATPTNVEPTTLVNCVGIARLSTSNNWHIIHNDNTGTCTSIDLGSGYPSNTLEVDLIYLRLTFNTNGTVSYLVANKTTNISTSGVLSTNLPAVALYEMVWTCNNATALAARLGFCYRTFSNS
jgi:hypothetical protein